MGAELAPGSVFAGHRIEAVAGRGGMGVVYRATQLALDRTVALKLIAPGLLEDEGVRARFLREAKLAAAIEHPNVLPIHSAGEEDGVAFIAMRYVAGDDLRSLVRREGPLEPARATAILAQTASALDAAHAAGLVHRDVKPANLLLGPQDHVYLTDFGLTKHAFSEAGTGATHPGGWVGTLDYVAPEQIRGGRIDARTDVYALGGVLVFALTGEVAFRREGDEARMYAQLNDPPPRVSERRDGVPAALDAVVARALAKEPGERYPSAGDLGRAALAALAAGAGGDAGGAAPARERVVATGAAAPTAADDDPTISAVTPPGGGGGSGGAGARRDSAATAATRALPRREESRVVPILILVVLALLVVAGVAGAVYVGLRGDDARRKARAGATATPTAAEALRITTGERPNTVALAGGNVFVGSFGRTRLDVFRPADGRRLGVRPAVGAGIADMATGFGSLWVALSRPDGRLVRLDPRTGRRLGSLALPAKPVAVAWGRGAIWVALITATAGGPDQLVKIDPRSLAIRATVPFRYGIRELAVSPSAVWVLSRRLSSLQQVSPATGQVTKDIKLGSRPADDVAYADGALWVADGRDDLVFKVDERSGTRFTVSVDGGPVAVVVSEGRVYVADENSSQVSRIDAESAQLAADPLRVVTNPIAIAADGREVWVVSANANALERVRDAAG